LSASRLLRGCFVLAVALGSEAAPAQSRDGSGAEGAVEHFWSQQRITAWARADYYQSSNNLDGERNLLGATLQMKALPRLTEQADGKVEVRLAAPDSSSRRGYGPQTELLESYMTLHFERADLRLGKQVIAWGRADGINPTGNLTPRNYRVLLPLEEDQRFGTWGSRLDLYLSRALTFELFASTFFEPAQFPLPTGAAALESRVPGHSVHDGEVGVKLSKVSGDFDCSLSYYNGYSLLPALIAAPAVIQLYYPRTQVLGADFARNFGRFGFRSEIAYTLPQRQANPDPNASRRRLFWVGGVDRTFFDNLNLNLQYFVRWTPGYEKPADLSDPRALSSAAVNALVGGQERGATPGITFRVSDQWLNDTLRAELLSFIDLARGDQYLRPLITYDFSDRIRFLLGANLYGGPRDSPFGILKPDSGVFMELRFAL